MSKKLYFESEEKWKAYREGKLTASIAGAINGTNDYESPLELWERLTHRTPEIVQNTAMKVGSIFEEAVLTLAAMDNDIIPIRDRNDILMYEHDLYDWLAVSPDDIVYYEGVEMLCEIKTTKLTYDIDHIPKYNYDQMQIQMLVSGYTECLFISFQFFNVDYIFGIVPFNEEYANALLSKYVEFHEYITSDTPPPPITHSDYDKQNCNSKEIEASEDVVNMFLILCQLNDIEKQAKSQSSDIKLEIKEIIGENESISKNGTNLMTYKPTKKGTKTLRINYKNIDKL